MTPEQRACFGFAREPFTIHSGDQPWFDPARRKAFERLQQLVDRGGYALVHGSPGCGKTHLLQHLIEQSNPNTHQPATIAHATLNEGGMLQTLAWKLGVEPAHSQPRNLRRLINHFNTNTKTPLLIFDELQHAAVNTLEALRLLCEEPLNCRRKIPVFLAGTDDFVGLLAMKICQSLRQRITLCVKIEALKPEQVGDYIQHHFAAAKVDHGILDPAAVKLIAEITDGVPRLIEHLTRTALEITADEQQPNVTIDHVHQAAQITFIPKMERTEA